MSSEAAGPEVGPRRYTLTDMQPSSGGWRAVPRVIAAAIRLVRRAAPRQYTYTVVLQVLGAAVLGGILLIGRTLLRDLISATNGADDLSGLVPAFVALLGLTLLGGVIAALIVHQQRVIAEYVGRHAFDHILDVANEVDLQAFEEPAFYDQLERARTSGRFRPVQIVNSVTTAITGVLTSIGVAIAIAALEPLLLPLVLLAGVPVFIATIVNSRQAYEFEYALTPQSRERFYLMELMTDRDPAKEMRVFGATDFLRERYDDLTDERIAEMHKYLRRRLRVSLLGTLGTALGTGAALASLAWLLASDRIDVATAATAGIAMQVLASRLQTITRNAGVLVEAGMFLDDYTIFLRLGIEHERRMQQRRLERGGGPTTHPSDGLALEHVSFAYPGTERRVLEDVTIEVRPGEVVAIVGENGSGKTTLVKVICALYQPDDGHVFWRGQDVDTIGPAALRDDITVIFQDFIQYHLTASENVSLGRVERDPRPEDVEAAARQAGAHGFVERLPDGYETRLGRQFYGGHELSIGQWQRLALARAFFRGGEFLILDEPTASLDPRAEHQLFEQMRELARGRSVVLISHRFSSVRPADRIYVLDKGRVIESGSHDELMALDGHYAELFTLQAQMYLREEEEAGGTAHH